MPGIPALGVALKEGRLAVGEAMEKPLPAPIEIGIHGRMTS